MKFAVQLYSLRNQIAAGGMKKALAEVREAGYDGVEFAGFGDLSPEQAKAETDALGLTAMGIHIGLSALASEEGARLADLFGFETMTVPHLPAEALAQSGTRELFRSALAALGAKTRICYHNHSFEFAGGDDLLKKLLADVPGIFAETDIFWLTDAGLVPEDYIRALGERVLLLHIKEMANGGGRGASSPVVGLGRSHCREALALGREMGLPWAVLETEAFDGETVPYLSACLAAMKEYAK